MAEDVNEEKLPEGINSNPKIASEFVDEVSTLENKMQNIHGSQLSNENGVESAKSQERKKIKKKGIFVSYSYEAPYEEKKFVLELVKQLGEIGLQDEIWFDKDVLQEEINSPFFISNRLDAAERCKAAVMILSEAYFATNQTRCEAELLLARMLESSYPDDKAKSKPLELFIVKFNKWSDSVENIFELLLRSVSVDLSFGKISRLSEAEKVSMFIEVLNKKLEEIGDGFSMKVPKLVDEPTMNNLFKKKPLVNWTVKDVQDWLLYLKIHEKYIISFEEFEIDGYLLITLTDSVLSDVLAVDSQICRRKILQRVKLLCDEESRTGSHCEWLKYKSVRQKPNQAYLIQDPSNEQLGNILKTDLQRKGIRVLSHNILGQSKEDFLRANASNLAASSHCILLLTEKACDSPFVFYEAVLSEWLKKPLIVAIFQFMPEKTRPGLSSLLSDKPAINFETLLYLDGLDLLWDEIKPVRVMSGVVFEQRYLRHIEEGIRPFRETTKQIGALSGSPELQASAVSPDFGKPPNLQPLPKVFISYHWDCQLKVRGLIRQLQSSHFSCWSDMEHVTKRPLTQQSMPRMTPSVTSRMGITDSLTSEIEHNIKTSNAVVLCVTQRYLQSANFLKEVGLASSFSRPLVVVLLQWVAWPPDSVPGNVKRIFASIRCIDMSNDKLSARNMPLLVSHLLQLSSSCASLTQTSL
eukprot:gene4776-5403_t